MEPLARVNLDVPQFDQNTFGGRLKHFVLITDMRMLLTTDARLQEAKKSVEEYKKAGCPPVSEEHARKLYRDKRVLSAMIHPDTGDKILLPVRLSAFVPMNVLICAGMLAPNPSIGAVLFWQWVNQSYNIALNHANRNASNTLTNETIAYTYGIAVAISCSVAVGLGQLAKRSTMFSPTVSRTITRFVPFTAVATAGVANVFLMRGNEIKEGIDVKDKNGDVVGKSPKAGILACSQVASSRVMTALPCLTFPPIIMGVLEKTKFVRSNPGSITGLNLAVIAVMLSTALPVAVAMYPQQVSISPQKLETKFHNLRDKNGKPITELYFNRGL